jgi:polar amino acid transport system substrate-binding protein
MGMRNIRLSMLSLIWLLCLSAPSVSAEVESSQARNFKVCTHDLPPHSMKLKDGRPSGIATEILLAVTHRLGWHLTIQYYPWMRARVEAEKGYCDLIYTILKTPEYEKFAVYPKEHLEDRYNVIIVRKNSDLTYNGNLEEFMRRYRVGTYRDKVVSPLFDRLKTESWARLEYTTNSENIIRMLLSDRVDAVIENKATALYELGLLGKIDEAKILSPPVFVTPVFIAFSKNGKALPFLEEFENELKAFKLTHQYRTMVSTLKISPEN